MCSPTCPPKSGSSVGPRGEKCPHPSPAHAGVVSAWPARLPRHPPLQLVFFCLLLFWSADCAGQRNVLHIRGSVEYVTYHNDLPDIRAARPFELWVNGCEWYARLGCGEGPDAGPFRGFEVRGGPDDVSVATVFDQSRFAGGVSQPRWQIGQLLAGRWPRTAVAVTNQIEVTCGPIPFGGMLHLTPVWFAYASTCFLDAAKNDRIKRFYTLSEAEFNLTNVFVRMVSGGGKPGGESPPGRVEFHNDGRSVIPLGGGRFEEKVCRPPYDRGYLDALYEVTDYFDSSKKIPKRFSLTFYRGVVGAATNTEVSREAGYRVESSFSEVTTISPVPLSGAQADLDRRDEDQHPAEQTVPSWGVSRISAPKAGTAAVTRRQATVFDSPAIVYDHRVRDSSGQPARYLATNGAAWSF